MRVGLDLLYLVPGETGGRETYARELVPAMQELAPELGFVAFVNRDAVRHPLQELEAAQRLFQLFREMDQMEGVKQIFVEPVPERGLGRAIMNRIGRAAG